MLVKLIIRVAIVTLSFFCLSLQAAESLSIEINKTEQRENHCRIYLFTQNSSSYAFDALKLDLVLFDQNSIIKKNMALNLAPLPNNKKSVKAFEVKNTACTELSSLLINEVIQCNASNETITDCLELMKVSSKTNISLTK